jgi:hypothetical protein
VFRQFFFHHEKCNKNNNSTKKAIHQKGKRGEDDEWAGTGQARAGLEAIWGWRHFRLPSMDLLSTRKLVEGIHSHGTHKKRPEKKKFTKRS